MFKTEILFLRHYRVRFSFGMDGSKQHEITEGVRERERNVIPNVYLWSELTFTVEYANTPPTRIHTHPSVYTILSVSQVCFIIFLFFLYAKNDECKREPTLTMSFSFFPFPIIIIVWLLLLFDDWIRALWLNQLHNLYTRNMYRT